MKQKKKIGIITMHTPINYGSYLQTFALYDTISKMGYDVEIIDYRYPTDYHKSLKKDKEARGKVSLSFLVKKIVVFFCNLFVKSDEKKLLTRLDAFYLNKIRFSREYNSYGELENTPPLYDIYVTGSDQVWNPENVGFDKSYLLSWVPQNKKKISYAASFGMKELPPQFCELYKQELSKYDYLSVREESQIIPQLLCRPNNVVLDPTFLLTQKDWMALAGEKPKVKGKYILCYILSYKYTPYPYIYTLVDEVKKRLGYNVVFLDNDPIRIIHGYKLANNMGPLDFVNLFIHASFVITTSFHGTAFAINTNKLFLTVVSNGTNDNRQLALLKELGIEDDCIVFHGNNPRNVKLPNINWGCVNEKLSNLRRFSYNFLFEALK